MSDQSTSGETPAQPSAPAAFTETSSATPAPVPTQSFGTSRGSGLARGKRTTTVAPTPASAAPRGDYKPTAVQVIVAEREYQNPFAPATPLTVEVTAPVPVLEVNSPETSTSPVAAAVGTYIEPGPVITPSPLAEPGASAPVSAPVAEAPEPFATSPAPVAEKASLTILPPAETRRPATSWDNSSPRPENARPAQPSRREDRAVFRAERPGDPKVAERFNDTRPAGSSAPGREVRPPRDPREAREPRDPRDSREPRPARDERDSRPPRESRAPQADRGAPAKTFTPVRPTPPTTPVDAKSGGFVGWLKGLFSGSSAEAARPAPTGTPASNGHDKPRYEDRGGSRDGQRRRQGGGGGGRGRGGFENRAPRDGQGPGPSASAPRPEGGEAGAGAFGQGPAGDQVGGEGGQRRRRHRGGRGRNRGEFGGTDTRGPGASAPREGGDGPSSSS